MSDIRDKCELVILEARLLQGYIHGEVADYVEAQINGLGLTKLREKLEFGKDIMDNLEHVLTRLVEANDNMVEDEKAVMLFATEYPDAWYEEICEKAQVGAQDIREHMALISKKLEEINVHAPMKTKTPEENVLSFANETPVITKTDDEDDDMDMEGSDDVHICETSPECNYDNCMSYKAEEDAKMKKEAKEESGRAPKQAKDSVFLDNTKTPGKTSGGSHPARDMLNVDRGENIFGRQRHLVPQLRERIANVEKQRHQPFEVVSKHDIMYETRHPVAPEREQEFAPRARHPMLDQLKTHHNRCHRHLGHNVNEVSNGMLEEVLQKLTDCVAYTMRRPEQPRVQRNTWPSIKDSAMPTFSGEEPYKWFAFWEEFQTVYGNRDDISDSRKYILLRDNLVSPAKDMFACLPPSDENYHLTVARLQKMFGSPGQMEKSYLGRLQSIVATRTASDVNTLMKIQHEQFNILQYLNSKGRLIGILHIEVVKKAYPKALRDKIDEAEAMYMENNNDPWTMDQMMNYISVQLRVKRMQNKNKESSDSEEENTDTIYNHHGQMAQQKHVVQKQSHQGPTAPQQSHQVNMQQGHMPFQGMQYANVQVPMQQNQHQMGNFMPPNYNGQNLNNFNQFSGNGYLPRNAGYTGQRRRFTPICAYCGKGHALVWCRDLPTLLEKQIFIKQARLCEKCLSPQHTVEACRRDNCKKCNGTHGLTMCPQMYTNGEYNKENLQDFHKAPIVQYPN